MPSKPINSLYIVNVNEFSRCVDMGENKEMSICYVQVHETLMTELLNNHYTDDGRSTDIQNMTKLKML